MQASQKRRALYGAIGLLTVAQFNSDLYLPSMPSMVTSLSATTEQVQATVILAMLAFGSALLFWGPLSDRFGRRWVILRGLLIYGLGTLLAVSATSIEGLWGARILQGIGISAAGAVAPAIPKDCYEGVSLLKAFAAISMALAIMPMLAQVLGGYLQALYGWRANFAFMALYAGIIFWGIYRFFPETHTPSPKPVGAPSLLEGYWGVLIDRTFWGYLLCMTWIFGGESIYLMVAPFVFQQDIGISEIQHGWMAIFSGGGLLLGATLSSRMAKRFSVNALIALGLPLIMVASALMAWFSAAGWLTVPTFLAPVVLYMVGAGLIYPNCIAGIMNHFPQQSGLAGALMSSLQMLGAGLVSALVSQWVGHTFAGIAGAFAWIVVLTLMSFALLVRPTRRIEPAGVGA